MPADMLLHPAACRMLQMTQAVKCMSVQVYAWLGVEPPRGVLLHGPPGCGKTALANAIANQCGVPFLRVSAPEIVSGMSGRHHHPFSPPPPSCTFPPIKSMVMFTVHHIRPVPALASSLKWRPQTSWDVPSSRAVKFAVVYNGILTAEELERHVVFST